jgi:hypothetical protein
MATFYLLTNLLNSATTATMWAVSQGNAPTVHYLFELLSLANWTSFTSPLVIVLALAATNNPRARHLTVSAFWLGRRALVYLVERAGSLLVDRLLEMLIIALIAMMASVSWLTGIAGVLLGWTFR